MGFFSNVPPTELFDWLHVMSNSLSAVTAVHAAVLQTSQRRLFRKEGEAADIAEVAKKHHSPLY